MTTEQSKPDTPASDDILRTASDAYEMRRQSAQGYPNPFVPLAAYALVGFDVELKPGEPLHVTEVQIRNPLVDQYGTGVIFEIRKQSKWVTARASWTDMGKHHLNVHGQGMFTRVWCHNDYRESNIEAAKETMANAIRANLSIAHAMLAVLVDAEDAAATPMVRAASGVRP